MTKRVAWAFAPVIALIIALLAPLALSSFAMTIALTALVYAMFALSLDLVLGHAGMPSLGHAAFFGTGAYAVAILAQHGIHGLLPGLATGVLAALLLGLLLGPALLRTRGTYFLMATLAVSQVMWNLAESWRTVTHGDDGLFSVAPAPLLGLNLADPTVFYYVLLAALCLLLILLAILMQAPFGHAVRALRDNRGRLSVLGVRPFTVELTVFVISAAATGLAGAMFAFAEGFASPSVYAVETSALALLMVVLGGAGTSAGPVIGAIVVEIILGIGSLYTPRFLTILGLLAVVVALDIPGRLRARRPAPIAETTTDTAPLLPATPRPHPNLATTPIFAAENLVMRFAGLSVLDGISLSIAPGERRGLIGPNGAGKTTLLNILSGLQRPTAGRVLFAGTDITAFPAHSRARLGLGRTFQVANLFDARSIRDNIVLALLARDGLALRVARNLRHYRALQDEADHLLASWRLTPRANTRVDLLSYGERRIVEIVLALAARPKLLLLDEPAAGLSGAETTTILRTIADLDPALTILLVEHDMDLIFSLCDRVTVIAAGRVLAEGPGDIIRRDPDVIAAYLGMPL
jgi:ABC-type branched-subunit amino acid transport system ATPase component/ABC-type branched-subunit amino acid transport system permease subunit